MAEEVAGTVKCPVCAGDFKSCEINSHLDKCLDHGGESDDELGASAGPPAKKSRVSTEAQSGSGAGTSGAEVKPKRPAGGVFSVFNNKSKSFLSSKQTAGEGMTRDTALPGNATESDTLPGSASENRKQRDEAETLNQKLLNSDKPLAEKMRPSTLEEYFGQNKVLGEHTLIRALLQSQEVPSLILWGPAGCGKVSHNTPDICRTSHIRHIYNIRYNVL